MKKKSFMHCSSFSPGRLTCRPFFTPFPCNIVYKFLSVACWEDRSHDGTIFKLETHKSGVDQFPSGPDALFVHIS